MKKCKNCEHSLGGKKCKYTICLQELTDENIPFEERKQMLLNKIEENVSIREKYEYLVTRPLFRLQIESKKRDEKI